MCHHHHANIGNNNSVYADLSQLTNILLDTRNFWIRWQYVTGNKNTGVASVRVTHSLF